MKQIVNSKSIISLALIKAFLVFQFPSVMHNDVEVIDRVNPITVTVTAYSPREEECDDTPFITAFQRPVKKGTIAISRDLETEMGWSKGDIVYIDGLGSFEVWDRMHPRWKRRVDVFFPDTVDAVSFGKKQASITKIERRVNGDA